MTITRVTAYDTALAFAKVRPSPLSLRFSESLVTGGVVSPPYVIRADGVRFGKSLRSFSKLIRDWRVHDALTRAAKSLMRVTASPAAYVVSDEVNVLITHSIYGGRVFKIVSVLASTISSLVSLTLSKPLRFDCRVIKLDKITNFIPYVIFRVRVGANNFVSKLYHSRRDVSETPHVDVMIDELKDELRSWGSWACTGTLLTRSYVVREGFNPLTNEKVQVVRAVIKESRVESPRQVTEALTRTFKGSLAECLVRVNG